MTQAYFPGTTTASPSTESTVDLSPMEKQLKVEDVQEAYVEQKDRLVTAIDSTKSILGDLRKFNKEDWVVRYPQVREQVVTNSVPKRNGARRSLSFADDPSTETDVLIQAGRPGAYRSFSLASTAVPEDSAATDVKEEETLIPKSEFHVLRLDLKMGAHGSPSSLVSQLEKSSIANLIDERISSSLSHIDKLRTRVEDTSSKVLVTGDLNAGKSTFVNALLRREVMPVDQQPCTTAFCEVRDAAENDNKEEVHVLKTGVDYDSHNESTFTRHTIAELDNIIGDNEDSDMMVKLFLADTRAPSESLLNNGVVDISLIDAPGLNRDSLKTTAVFSQQEEIDVVVFVVSAENHFTLSAKEFLWTATKEKAYVFIVVNKYDQIRNKEKCRRIVLEQIKQFSPRTYEDAQDLVHFVDSAAALHPSAANPAFDDLESALRSFVLVKRSKSKLQPASTYLLHVLSDIDLLAGANTIVAQSEIEQAKANLDRARPVLEKMKNGRDALEDGLENVEEQGVKSSSSKARSLLGDALERVGQGKLGADNTSVSMPAYPGFFGIWDYARDVRKALLSSLDAAVKLAEDEARLVTSAGVDNIKQLADEHLPEGVERSRRVFMPEAMFAARKPKNSRRHSRSYSSIGGAIVAGGLNGLGIGLSQRPDMLETTFFDLFDAHHHFWVAFGNDEKHGKGLEEESSMSALSVVSVGAGALTMVGGQAIGARSLVAGIIRLSDLMGNETARKWAAPVIGAVTVGLTAYLILELPNSIPRTVGRRIKASLDHKENDEEVYVETHAGRISRETRKVLRLASWDLKERFRGAMEERVKEVKGAEEMEKKATKAKEWFEDVQKRTLEVREEAVLVEAA